MAVKYTTATIVRSLIDQAGSSMTDAEIEEVIEMCEAWVDAWLKIDDTFSFSASTIGHKLLRLLVSTKAARIIVASTPLSHQTLTQAAMTLDLLQEEYEEAVKIAGQTDVRDYIVGSEGTT